MADRPYLIDVSRLIWRVWNGRLPTGIDRVCLAYLERFGDRAQAIVHQWGFWRILTAAQTDSLTRLLIENPADFRRQLLPMIPFMSLGFPSIRNCAGKVYLNIGHTGLDQPSLRRLIRRYRLKAVFLVHDLIPITHPEFCREGEAEKHRIRMLNALVSAAGIIGNSQSTLTDLELFAQTNGRPVPPRIPAWISGHVIPNEVTPRRMARPYFVTVGTIEGRKNHILLLQLWLHLIQKLGNRTPQLIIVGQRGWESDHAQAMIDRTAALRGHVVELKRCEDDELASIIAGARALLMPSFAEGFGLPVVEALQLGTPVIASDLPVFREIAGDIPVYLDPTDGAGWEREILAYCEDSPDRARQVAALEGYRAPDWQGHFSAVEPWLAQL
jgi:glycosyltransferase involved in cell wall biosynthesis